VWKKPFYFEEIDNILIKKGSYELSRVSPDNLPAAQKLNKVKCPSFLRNSSKQLQKK